MMWSTDLPFLVNAETREEAREKLRAWLKRLNDEQIESVTLCAIFHETYGMMP
jgi:hypothetical protein